jgi:hypothetical protein
MGKYLDVKQQILCFVSQERLDWCVIAMLDNSNSSQPWMYPVNKVVADEPDVTSSFWRK